MNSQPGRQKIAVNILPDISKIKGNETMRFCRFIEYNMNIIFLEK